MNTTDDINGSTALYGLIGHPVHHSFSPLIHNTAFKTLRINSRYLAFDIQPRRLRQTLAGAGALGIRGLNVTVPYKESVLKYLDKLSPDARFIGAVNTIVFDNGKSYGYNTDCSGFTHSLEFAKKELHHANVLIFGAGGSARAVLYALMKNFQCRKIVVSNRTRKNALELINRFSKLNRNTKLEIAEPVKLSGDPFQLIVHTTSVGLNDAASLVPTEFFRKGQWVYDLIYNPIETVLLQHAKVAGATTINGLEMLIGQAAEAFRIWTGRPMPLEEVRAAVNRFIADPSANMPI